jgi:hypothetical protein
VRLDAALGLCLLAGNALGVDAEQDTDAVACPLGDLGRRFPWSEGSSASLVKDLEVSPVVEDAAARTCEYAPVGAAREFFRCWLSSTTSSGWIGTGRVSPVGRCLSSRRCRAGQLSVHKVPLAEQHAITSAGRLGASSPARFGGGQDQFAPAVVGQASEILRAKFDGFLGAQSGVVHAAEERDHPLTAFALLADCSKQPPGLVDVDHGPRVHVPERAGASPSDRLDRFAESARLIVRLGDGGPSEEGHERVGQVELPTEGLFWRCAEQGTEEGGGVGRNTEVA